MIYLASDLHIVKWDKGVTYINIEALEAVKQWRPLNQGDQLIFLGDLVDAEILDVRPYAYIFNLIADKIKDGNNIFIRGNNDTFPNKTYMDMEFNKVEYATFIKLNKENILLSHTSINITECPDIDYNIHGHVHRSNVDPDTIVYYHPCEKNINLCTFNKREYTLTDINEINRFDESHRNRMYEHNNEKPGMTQFIRNKVFDTIMGCE